VIGVVGDVKQFSPEDVPGPQIYVSDGAESVRFTSVAVRTALDPAP